MIQTNSRKVFRANLDDVENLSYGKGAKKQRGTGSRFTCHRLNRDERRIFDQAKRDGFLTVRGTGYRKNRKGSPVANTFRQRCDALARPFVTIEKRSDSDRVVIDFSTLRVQDDSSLVSFLIGAVFRTNYPNIYDTFTANNEKNLNCQQNTSSGEDGGDNTAENMSIQIENTINRPVHWEIVRTKPIWGVDERLLAVSCEREVARSIAMNVLEVFNSPHFVSLQADAEAKIESASAAEPTAMIMKHDVEGTQLSHPHQQNNTTRNLHEGDVISRDSSDCASDNKSGDDIDCIDWDDI